MNYHFNSDVPVLYGRVVPKEKIVEEAEGGLRDFHLGGVSGRYNYLDK